MSDQDSILSQPVLFFKALQNGDYLFEERLLRPIDFPNLFPWGTPTFPASPPAVTHPAFPFSANYGAIPQGTIFPSWDNPAQTWASPERLYLFRDSMTVFIPGYLPFDLNNAKQISQNFIYRNHTCNFNEIPASNPLWGIPYLGTGYTALPPLSYPTMRGLDTSPILTAYIPNDRFGYAVTFAAEQGYDRIIWNFCQVDGSFLWVWDGYPPANNSVLIQGTANQNNSITYWGTNTGVSIACLNPIISTHQIFNHDGMYTWHDISATYLGRPIDRFVTFPQESPKRSSILPALTALGLLGGLILCASDGNPPAHRRRKRKIIKG